MAENVSKRTTSDLNITSELSRLPKNLNLEQKIQFVVDMINTSLDTYLKHLTDEILKETKKIMLSHSHQDQVCVDLTNEDENCATRKHQQNTAEEKNKSYDHDILKRVLVAKKEQLNVDFKTQMKKVKQFVNENINNSTSKSARSSSVSNMEIETS